MSTKAKSGILSLVIILIFLVNVWINFTKASVGSKWPSANSLDKVGLIAQNSTSATTQTELVAVTTDPTTTTTNTDIISEQDNKIASINMATEAPGLCSNKSIPTNTSDINKYFDIRFACKTFEECMNDVNAVPLYNYIAGFKELMKFFNSLGTIFLFVTSDLETKIGLLESYRRLDSGDCNPQYATIQTTIEYETRENLLRDPKRPSGSRTILRLHRALQFLSALMSNLSKLDNETETATATRDAYSLTLANHHPWTIRTIASLAMRTLPSKKQLVEDVIGPNNPNVTSNINEEMLKLSRITSNLFELVDRYYTENNIQDLP